MRIDTARVRAVVRKELRDYRRRRSIVVTMIILPVVFLIEPTLTVFLAPAGTNLQVPLLLLLLIPVVTPSTLAAYSIVGEREQGTLASLFHGFAEILGVKDTKVPVL